MRHRGYAGTEEGNGPTIKRSTDGGESEDDRRCISPELNSFGGTSPQPSTENLKGLLVPPAGGERRTSGEAASGTPRQIVGPKNGDDWKWLMECARVMHASDSANPAPPPTGSAGSSGPGPTRKSASSSSSSSSQKQKSKVCPD